MTARVELPVRDRAVWGLFTDWCAAHDHEPLPVGSVALAQFLAANPAASATQRRRVAVINAAHRAAGAAPPGRAEQVRQHLDARRAARLSRRTRDVAAAVAALPTAGWPTLLFARRDALLLVLATTGITYTAMSRLKVGDLSPGSGGDVTVMVDGIGLETSSELRELGVDPVSVVGAWLDIRALQQRAPSTRVLAAHLRGDPTPRVSGPSPELPLVTPLDRWGAEPLRPTPLTSRAVWGVVTSHLAGTASAHRAIGGGVGAVSQPVAAPSMPVAAPTLDPDSFSRGIAARRHAEESLADITDVLDEVADRADRLMTDLLALLDGTGSGG